MNASPDRGPHRVAPNSSGLLPQAACVVTPRTSLPPADAFAAKGRWAWGPEPRGTAAVHMHRPGAWACQPAHSPGGHCLLSAFLGALKSKGGEEEDPIIQRVRITHDCLGTEGTWSLPGVTPSLKTPGALSRPHLVPGLGASLLRCPFKNGRRSRAV